MAYARACGIVVSKLKECSGVPDRIFFLPKMPLIIEFKAKGEVPEALQSWYLKTLKKAGYKIAYCDTWEKFLWLFAKCAGKEVQKTVAVNSRARCSPALLGRVQKSNIALSRTKKSKT